MNALPPTLPLVRDAPLSDIKRGKASSRAPAPHRPMMKTIEYKVEFLTPAFLGNAEQSGQWRTPPFKALLRQWWRVAWAARHGFQVDINAMRHEEGKLFGNVGPKKGSSLKSRVWLRLEDWSDGKLNNDKWREEVQSVASLQSPANPSSAGRAFYPLHYVGYGLLKNARQMEETRSPAIGCGESKMLRIAAPGSDIDYIRDAMRLVHLYGALGGRSRNGWGSVDLMDNSEANTSDLTLTRPWKEALNLDWPHAIGKDENGPLIWETKEFQGWGEIMKEFGELRKSIRKIIKAPRGSTRLPNTIRFKVRKSDRNGHIKGVIFHMPCKPPAEINDQTQVSDWEKAHRELENSLSRSKE